MNNSSTETFIWCHGVFGKVLRAKMSLAVSTGYCVWDSNNLGTDLSEKVRKIYVDLRLEKVMLSNCPRGVLPYYHLLLEKAHSSCIPQRQSLSLNLAGADIADEPWSFSLCHSARNLHRAPFIRCCDYSSVTDTTWILASQKSLHSCRWTLK